MLKINGAKIAIRKMAMLVYNPSTNGVLKPEWTQVAELA